MIRAVQITKQAEKQLRKVSAQITVSAGQRSIRLSRSYRAIYEIKKNVVEFVSVEEISKHDY
jgi:hypothetical protein